MPDYDLWTPAYKGVGRRLLVPIVQVGNEYVAGCREEGCAFVSGRCPSWDVADFKRMLHALADHRAG